LVEDAVALLVDKFGYSLPKPRPEKDSAKDNGGGEGEDWSYLIENIRRGRDLHKSLRDLAGKLIASEMSKGAAVNFLRDMMERSEAPRDERRQARYDDIPRLVETAVQWKEQQNRQQEAPPPPLRFIDLNRWCNEQPPKREWSVKDRFPLRQVALLSGEGAVGKSIVLLQLCAAHVLGKDWLQALPEIGPVIYFGAEDDEEEMWRRMADIVAHYGATMSDLQRGGFHVISLAGQDAILARADRNGIVRPTPLFVQLKEAACDIKPKLIGLDTSSDIFAGNEIDRSEVRQFIGLLRGLAIESNSTVSVCTHPSLSGIKYGSGLSGSTAWHNSVRARAYMHKLKTDGGEELDPDLRQIEFMKNQYGKLEEGILVRWKSGVFVPEPKLGSFEQMASDRRADELFLKLLADYDKQGRYVSHKRSPTFAPAMFAKEPEAQAAKVTKVALEAAMNRLFTNGKIKAQDYGKPSRPYSRIVAT
jgi:RecA-family ATPase